MIEIERFIGKTGVIDKTEGKVLISKSNKMKLWFVILSSKTGGYYCVPPSVKIEDKWESAYKFLDANVMRKISHEIIDMLKQRGDLT